MAPTPEHLHLSNLDENTQIHFVTELEHLKAKSYDIMHRLLKHREFIPVSNDADPGAESIAYTQYDQVGTAKLIANYADDLPLANIKGKKFSAPVHSLGIAFSYSLQDVRASAKSGKRLEQRQANSAARANAELEERLASVGDTNAGLSGFLNHPNVPTISALDPGAGKAWIADGKTPDQILNDMNLAVSTILETTNEVEEPDTIILPTREFNYIAQKRLTDLSMTIRRWFLEESPWISSIGSWNRLRLADATGTGPRMVVYRRDPDKLQMEIPQEYEILPVQQINLSYKVPTHSRYGGISFYYPLSAIYMDHI